MNFDWKIIAAAWISWLQARAKERSTQLGVVAFAASLGITISPEFAYHIMSAAGFLASAILVFIKDKATTEVVQVVEVAPQAKTVAKTEKQILKG